MHPGEDLLRSLRGTERSLLEVTIDSDGTLLIYEAYSQERADRLVQRLADLGVRARVVSSSPCG